ncbi:Peroxisome biogenesis protein 19-1 [Porphyridium purpureum]|uniref:Peroxisome biogenesis protein 19-1 n=1 Tax=Porphyridium purpureum TaxID=35688 RepID=A0A5J4YTB0_PORPP|nr:Peroxisome biogenesis protein 19-1 [Porphyridium purpureum]|eukprot:POR3033..scf227_4
MAEHVASKMEEDDEDELLDGLLDSALDEFDCGTRGQGNDGSGSGSGSGSRSASTDVAGVLAAKEGGSEIQGAPLNNARGRNPAMTSTVRETETDPLLRALSALNTANAAAQEKKTASGGGPDADDLMMKELLEALSKSMPQGQEGDEGDASDADGVQNILHELLNSNRASGARSGDAPSRSAAETASGSDASAPSEANPDQFEALVEGIMAEILSTDLMKAPITQVKAQYDSYLASEEAAALDPAERERYQKQALCMAEIVQTYDTGSDLSRVQELLEKMQDYGEPPPSIAAEIDASREAEAARGNASASASEAGNSGFEDGENLPAELEHLQKFADQCATQ